VNMKTNCRRGLPTSNIFKISTSGDVSYIKYGCIVCSKPYFVKNKSVISKEARWHSVRRFIGIAKQPLCLRQ